MGNFDNRARISEQEVRLTWLSIVELDDALREVLARLDAPPLGQGRGMAAVRAMLGAALEGRRDDDWWDRFRRPKEYAGGLPEPPPFDANAMDGQTSAVPLSGSPTGDMFDVLTGGGDLAAPREAIVELTNRSGKGGKR